MKEIYRKFKQWAEQKTVQEVLTVLLACAFGTLILLVALLYRSQISMIASITKRSVLGTLVIPTITLIPTLTPLPTPKHEPTNTPIPYHQYQQTYQPPVQQQTNTTVYCDITKYVPEGQRMSAYLTPDQCAYEQSYAVALYNKTVGGTNQPVQLPLPQPVYNYPSYNANVPLPPAMGQQPALQQPVAPNGSVNYQPPVVPTNSCRWVCTSNSNCMQLCN